MFFSPDPQLQSSTSVGLYSDQTICDFIAYIVDYTKLFESGEIDSATMINNLGPATILQSVVMQIFGVDFRTESAARLGNSDCRVIRKLISTLCVTHFKGKRNLVLKIYYVQLYTFRCKK